MDSASKAEDRPSLIGRALHRVAVFLVAMCIGVAGILAWQSPGSDPARQRMANWAQQQGWTAAARILAPKTDKAAEQPSPPAPPAQVSTRETLPQAAGAAAIAPASSSHEVQQLEVMARELAAVRQNVEQLARDQKQLAPDQRQMAVDQKQLAAQEQIAADLKQLTTRQEEMAADQKQLAASREQMATDLKHDLAAGQERVAREIAELQTAVRSMQNRISAPRRHPRRH